MATHRRGERAGPDDQADTLVRPTARTDDDAPGRPPSARVVVIAGEDSPITRYASWLAATYETQIVRRGETMSPRPETDVLMIDRRTRPIAGERARGTVGPRRRDCRVLAPAALQSGDGPIDERFVEPIGRARLLRRVEAAMRMAVYDVTIAELLSLTMRRRKLRNCSHTGRADHDSDIASLSERIDELHRRIDDELWNVESNYAAFLGQKHRPSTRQQPGSESA